MGWKGMKRDEKGWKGMKRDEKGWKGMKRDEKGWKGMKRDEKRGGHQSINQPVEKIGRLWYKVVFQFAS